MHRYIVPIIYFLLFTGCATTLKGKISSPHGPLNPATFQNARVNVINQSFPSDSQIVAISTDGSFELDEKLDNHTYLVEGLIPGYRSKSQMIKGKTQKFITIQVEPLPAEYSKTVNLQDTTIDNMGIGHAQINAPEL